MFIPAEARIKHVAVDVGDAVDAGQRGTQTSPRKAVDNQVAECGSAVQDVDGARVGPIHRVLRQRQCAQ